MRFLFKIKMTFHIITLFPESFDSYINASILGRAVEKKKIKIKFYDLHDFGEGKWKKTDGRPYGGGPGMVLLPGPLLRAVKKALRLRSGQATKKKSVKVVILSPGGKDFTNEYGKKLSQKYEDIILICGRYEGIDARVKKILRAEDISIGPYVLTGGELPAMVMMDAISRQIEGVLGKFASLEENRVSSHEVYTRPEVFEWQKKKYRVPKVLRSGNHSDIEKWKKGE